MKTLVFVFVMTASLAFGSEYEEAMKAGIKDLYAARSLNEYQQVASKFERIASVESAQWLPRYYAGYAYVIMSSLDSVAENKDKYLDLSKQQIDKAAEIEPNNSELLALEGFNHMIRVSIDPGSRGQEYSGLSMQALNKAVAIDSENPRALYLLARMSYGTAQFFGGSTEESCQMLEKSLQLFETKQPASEIAPAWGKNQALGMKNICQ